ncbi:MAG: hypothetical protein WD709_08425 [Gammaproteobacteria bacterium]
MRSSHLTEGVVDLYAVVDSYKNAYQQASLRYINSWLPPNVFYLETGPQEARVRAKYAVVSMEDLRHGTGEWFHSYLWSRFAQPVRLLYARDTTARNHIYQSLADAVIMFLRTTIPTLKVETVDAEAIWINGLTLTYAAELRPERQEERARHITHQNMGDYTRLTQIAAPALADMIKALPKGYYQRLTGERERKQTLRQWRLRRWQGRVLSILRLTKAAYTFRDCVDYAAWKIQRHTGVQVEVTPGLRRHPVLFGFSVLWQLLRRGTIR